MRDVARRETVKPHAEYCREWRANHPGAQYAANKKWRRGHRVAWHRGKAKNYEVGSAHLTLAERATKRPWKPTEDRCVLRHIKPDRELARKLRRSVRAIQIRRCRLKGGKR